MKAKKKILILGISGLLGHKLFLEFSNIYPFVYGTTSNNKQSLKFFLKDYKNVYYNFDVNVIKNLLDLIKEINPDLVINCIAIT